MANTPQRSFAGGEIAPALHARADLARYAIGLRTCRNMVVMRAGGATKRPGTKFVNTAGVSPGYILTLTPSVSVVAAQNSGIVAVLTDWLGNPVTTFGCTYETDNVAIATIASTGSRTASVHGVADGTVHVRARIAALGIVSNDCVVTVEDYYILHAFVGDGTFNVTTAGSADYLMIAGAGSGGSVDGSGVHAGGGGAGEVIHETNEHFDVGAYPVVIGGGGIAPFADHTIAGGVFGVITGASGTDTTFKSRRARGGGGGGGSDATLLRKGRDGGSGGGGASADDASPIAGAYNGGSNTNVLPGVGNAGGNGAHSSTTAGGGGGGAGGPGSAGSGGSGVSNDITGSAVVYAQGGNAMGTGPGTSGSANSGSGGDGGGSSLNSNGGNGASGVVYVRYQASSGMVATGGIMTTLPL